MSKYTKTERHRLYKKVLETISGPKPQAGYGLCVHLPGRLEDMRRNYPELWAKKPERTPEGVYLNFSEAGYHYWWDSEDLITRRSVLIECITDTEEKDGE